MWYSRCMLLCLGKLVCISAARYSIGCQLHFVLMYLAHRAADHPNLCRMRRQWPCRLCKSAGVMLTGPRAASRS